MPGVKVQVQVQVQVARCKIFFKICHRFLISNLKILPIWFSQLSKCHLKDFHSRISKQGLLFGICDFSIFKIWSDVVNLWVGHPVYLISSAEAAKKGPVLSFIWYFTVSVGYVLLFLLVSKAFFVRVCFGFVWGHYRC